MEDLGRERPATRDISTPPGKQLVSQEPSTSSSSASPIPSKHSVDDLRHLDYVGLNVNDEGRVGTYNMLPPSVRRPVWDTPLSRAAQKPTESDRKILGPWIAAANQQGVGISASMEALTCVQPQRSQAQWTSRRAHVLKDKHDSIDFEAPFPNLVRNVPPPGSNTSDVPVSTPPTTVPTVSTTTAGDVEMKDLNTASIAPTNSHKTATATKGAAIMGNLTIRKKPNGPKHK